MGTLILEVLRPTLLREPQGEEERAYRSFGVKFTLSLTLNSTQTVTFGSIATVFLFLFTVQNGFLSKI